MTDYEKAAGCINEKIRERLAGFRPKTAIVLGSGLGGLADHITDPVIIDYAEIPGFCVATAPNHRGRLVAGYLGGAAVICMQGRLHFYEGHSMKSIIFPTRVFASMGVGTLIVTNAAGGINTSFSIGDIMLMDDHINLMGTNPLIGPNDEEFGERFCDMTFAYTPELKEAAFRAAEKAGVELKRGVYIAVTGPSYETPAEIRAFRALGADAVGMSTVPEVIAASHAGMRVLGFSLITNMAAGVLKVRLSGDEVIAVGERRAEVLVKLVKAVVDEICAADVE